MVNKNLAKKLYAKLQVMQQRFLEVRAQKLQQWQLPVLPIKPPPLSETAQDILNDRT
ncbi:hypothetical protein CANCADRAFT_30118 [Tortispora caseinolytica NRRL Y-17796]|uniref:Uncharacterized protein n=1 Tax=Tortispora caseinolytica NRRL Y-17796 TaxID=767744 RepID=A0A1E4TJ64_9ASCO|nr:hypothetical protein CANCADRAFT_30118 [Tortispora caseinolytica NRRL Y-17796]